MISKGKYLDIIWMSLETLQIYKNDCLNRADIKTH